MRPGVFDANGHWYAYAADPLVLLVTKNALMRKIVHEWTDLSDGLVEGMLFLTPHLRIRKKFESPFLGQYGLDKGAQIIQSLFEGADAFSESTHRYCIQGL